MTTGETMKYFDPHIHMSARTTDDYQRMAHAGILGVIEPAFWNGQPRTHAGSFEDAFLSMIGWEKFRAGQFGIHHFCTLSLNPKEANQSRIADEVIRIMRRYLDKDTVVGIGEIGLDDGTEAEEKYFRIQLELSREYDLPVLIHTPHRDKKEGTRQIIKIIKEMEMDEAKILIDHNTEETLPLVLDSTNCVAGHSIYPHTKMTEERMTELVKKFGANRIVINSAADWGVSDPLKVPATANRMLESGIPESDVQRIVWDNPIQFFAQSNRFDPADLETPVKIDQTKMWENNSVLRGQTPFVEK